MDLRRKLSIAAFKRTGAIKLRADHASEHPIIRDFGKRRTDLLRPAFISRRNGDFVNRAGRGKLDSDISGKAALN
jgi:hypothetical protein